MLRDKTITKQTGIDEIEGDETRRNDKQTRIPINEIKNVGSTKLADKIGMKLPFNI